MPPESSTALEEEKGGWRAGQVRYIYNFILASLEINILNNYCISLINLMILINIFVLINILIRTSYMHCDIINCNIDILVCENAHH